MNNKQLALLFSTMLVNFTVALGTLPFLPLHATTNLGADPSQAGVFLSIISMALTAGSIGGGWLSDRFGRRKLIMLVSALIALPSVFLIGSASNLFQITVLAAFAWLAIGTSSTMVRIVTGILADESRRGRIFGIIGAATPLSALIGGFIAGPIVDRWNMSTLFMIMSSAFVFQLVVLFFMKDVGSTSDNATSPGNQPVKAGFGMQYWLLAIGNLMLFTAISAILTGRPLQMDRLGFDGTAISQVLVPGAFISLPLTFYVGSLSDRFGRKKLMILCYLVSTLGALLLISSESLWHFWLSEAFLAFAGISIAVSSALVTDLVPKESLDTALSRIIAMTWMGTIIGFAISGYIIDGVGINMMFGVATIISLAALLMIVPIQHPTVRVIATSD